MASSEQRDEGVDVSDPLLQVDDSQRDILKVDRDSNDPNDYKSIGEAIDSAKENSIIHIAAGTYAESLVIMTPGLTLEPLEEDGKVILISTKKPCFKIQLNNDERIELK